MHRVQSGIYNDLEGTTNENNYMSHGSGEHYGTTGCVCCPYKGHLGKIAAPVKGAFLDLEGIE